MIIKNKKNKNLILFYIALFILLILAAFFLSEYIFLTLEQMEIEVDFFMPHRIIGSMAKNMNHLTVFFSMCLLIIFSVALLLNSNNINNFESEMDWITDTIQTPKAVGQGQHGTARWLKDKEYEKVFASYTIAPKQNETIKRLVDFGQDDIRAVRKGNDKPINESSNPVEESTAESEA